MWTEPIRNGDELTAAHRRWDLSRRMRRVVYPGVMLIILVCVALLLMRVILNDPNPKGAPVRPATLTDGSFERWLYDVTPEVLGEDTTVEWMLRRHTTVRNGIRLVVPMYATHGRVAAIVSDLIRTFRRDHPHTGGPIVHVYRSDFGSPANDRLISIFRPKGGGD